MKSVVLFAAVLTALVPARAAEVGGYKSESKASSEIFTSTITKVYSAQDGDHRFVAYAVVWRDQEVVVTPYSSRLDDLAVGETVRCEMRQMRATTASGGKGRMMFSLLGRPGDPASLGSMPNAAEEIGRLEAVSAEVARRRAEREAASGWMESNSSKPTKVAEPTPGSATPPAAK